MAAAGITLLAPVGLLACLTALVPLGVITFAFRRQQRVATALGLEPAGVGRAARVAALPVAACLLAGLAVAQPTLTTTGTSTARTSSELVFVTDVSQSMLASSGPGEPTRLERARAVVEQLRASVPDVPAGLTGLTDRALPYLFPTLDRDVFGATLAQSVQVDAPPPLAVSTVATTYEPLSSLTADGFFSRGTEHRTCVLVTDGETRAGLARPGCRLVVVRVGGPGDRIYGRDGTVDAGYRPEGTAASTVERLARVSGGAAFAEGDLRGASAALRRAAEAGPSHAVATASTSRSLAPYLAALALALVALVVARRYLRPAGGVSLTRGHRQDAAIEL